MNFNFKTLPLLIIPFIMIHHYVIFVFHSFLITISLVDEPPEKYDDIISIRNSDINVSHHNRNTRIQHENNNGLVIDPSTPSLHPLSQLIMDGKKIIILNIGYSASKLHGLGSQLSIMALIDLYFQGHELVLLQSNSQTYRYNTRLGFFGGFTIAPFLVLDKKDEYEKLVLRELYEHGYTPNTSTTTTPDNNVTLQKPEHEQEQVIYIDLDKIQHHKDVVSLFYKERKKFCPLGWPGNCPKSFIEQKARKLHTYFNYTPYIQNYIDNLLKKQLLEYGNSNSNNSSRSNSSSSSIVINESVAFHVRRGDKIIELKKHYSTDDYVQQLLWTNAIPQKEKENLRNIKTCILATDDIAIVLPELIASIKKFNMSCDVYPIFNFPHGNGKSRKEFMNTIYLLTEIEVLAKAKYFIGTLSSNIGDLIAHLRIPVTVAPSSLSLLLSIEESNNVENRSFIVTDTKQGEREGDIENKNTKAFSHSGIFENYNSFFVDVVGN